MSEEVRGLLHDVLTECHSIKEFVSGHTPESYKEGRRFRPRASPLGSLTVTFPSPELGSSSNMRNLTLITKMKSENGFPVRWLVVFALTAIFALSQGQDGASLADRAVQAAGGRDNVLRMYRFEDQLRVGDAKKDLLAPLDDRRKRISIIEAPQLWWLKKGGGWTERGKEPAKSLAYGWTLAVLLDPESKIEPLPEFTDAQTSIELVGLRVSGSVEPKMDLYFDKNTLLLARIDWDDEICRFSEWKEFEGFVLPVRCIGYRRSSNVPWYYCRVVDVARLAEVPAEVRGTAE